MSGAYFLHNFSIKTLFVYLFMNQFVLINETLFASRVIQQCYYSISLPSFNIRPH